MAKNLPMNAMIDRLRRTLRELRAANGANVTVTFALAVVPMVGFVGAAVDYSHANSVKAAMQAAADSTALMVSKDAATMTNAALQTKANDYFKALFTRPEATGVTVGATYNANTGTGSQVIVNASSNVKANFMGLMGVSQMRVAVDAQVMWGNSKMRVALALDTTGSMADDGKMDALKVATKSLLAQLKTAATNDGDVYVSIIPFSKDVNVGKSNYNQTWVDFKDHGSWDGWDSENGDDVSSTTCTKNGKKKKCTTSSSWVPDNHNTWNGCVTDRDQDYDTMNTTPSTSVQATLFPAEQYDSCPAQLMALSYDWSALNAKVDSLFPAGNTNQGIGLAWAFQSLTAAPFTIPTKNPNYKYSEIIILVTDGLNTENRFSTSQSSIDARELKTCANAKAKGIIIYTMFINTGGDPTQSVLQNCATDSGKYVEVKKSNQVLSAFNSIGTALSNLRIAQ
jgi:Flp pilus assembly protein TadG